MDSSQTIYNANFRHPLTLGSIIDIKTEDIPPHDILTGGFPCQPFSVAGKREGFNDPRSNVFWKIIEILNLRQPRFLILENVKNLTTHEDGRTFKIIIDALTNCGYTIYYKVLNTADITSIPQNRERIYIVGMLDEDIKFDLDFLTIPKLQPSQMLEQNIDDKYYYVKNANADLPAIEKGKNEIIQMLKNTVDDFDSVYQYRRVYVRKNKSNECPTLTANMGEGGHNVPIMKDALGIRKLTPRECFNFQGFSRQYNINVGLSDAKLYKLAGNAVSVPVVQLIINKLVEVLQL
jgi:DNA (cytosine-5)-methyltransferase 1